MITLAYIESIIESSEGYYPVYSSGGNFLGTIDYGVYGENGNTIYKFKTEKVEGEIELHFNRDGSGELLDSSSESPNITFENVEKGIEEAAYILTEVFLDRERDI